MRVEKGPGWKLQEYLGPGSTPSSAAPRTPQKDTFAAKGSYTPTGILFVPYRECALGARETRKTHVPGGAPRAASRALRWRRPPEATPRPAARPTASPSLPGDAPRRVSSQEAPGARDPARLSGSCVRLRPPGPESSSRPEGPRGWSWLGHVLLGSSSGVPRFPAEMWRRTRSPRGRRGGGGRRPGRSPGAGGVQGGEGERRSGRDPSAPRPAATALWGAQPHPRGTAPPPRGKAPEPRRTPATPGPGPETPRPSPRAALPASPARGSRPTRALARPAPQPAQSPPAAAAPFV